MQTINPIRSITRGLSVLQTPSRLPQGTIARYGYGFPFQVSSTTAAIFANIHCKMARTEDFELGTDVVLFDDLRHLTADRVIPVSRNHEEYNPAAKEMGTMSKQCLVGGFVPLGAKRPDGSPHPHAGTGFGWGMALSYAVDDGDLSKPYPGNFREEKTHIYYELYQFAFDGEKFTVPAVEKLGVNDLLPGQFVYNSPMRTAIADGDDLLSAGVVGAPGSTVQDIMRGEISKCGIFRWRKGENGWRAVEYIPVVEDMMSFEPTLVRDTDGSLLFTVRPAYESPEKRSILVWRSKDGGKSWEKIIHAKNIRFQSPITLNTAADGTPYIVCNHLLSALMDYEEGFMDGSARTTCREMLAVWALNPTRDALHSPHIASFPRYEYGPPPTYSTYSVVNEGDAGQMNKGRDWTSDHPTAMTLRLSDGRWHHLLCYRVLAQAEVQGPIPPTPYSGLHVEEVFSVGEVKPEWNF
ncbi:MAG: glycoside hydrolase [Armatimonadetes bacterium]|nr:glycoside hydrolase [Armatimonadota bacterium]